MSQRQWYWQLGVLEKLKFSICMRCCFKKYGGKQKYNQFTSAFPGEVIPSPQKNPIVLQKHFHPQEEEEEEEGGKRHDMVKLSGGGCMPNKLCQSRGYQTHKESARLF